MKRKFLIAAVCCLSLASSSFCYAAPTKHDAVNDNICVAKYANEDVHFRAGPSTETDILTTISKGKPVIAIEGKEEGRWVFVYVGNQSGYIYDRYLSDTKEEAMKKKESTATKMIYSPSHFKSAGVIYWGGWKWTWYSQRVLPGGGLRIPGRHVGANGYVMDGNNRICLASSSLRKGTVVQTPFGAEGCVYDSGCAAGILDVYTDF